MMISHVCLKNKISAASSVAAVVPCIRDDENHNFFYHLRRTVVTILLPLPS